MPKDEITPATPTEIACFDALRVSMTADAAVGAIRRGRKEDAIAYLRRAQSLIRSVVKALEAMPPGKTHP